MNTWCGVIWQIACSVYASYIYELHLMSTSSDSKFRSLSSSVDEGCQQSAAKKCFLWLL